MVDAQVVSGVDRIYLFIDAIENDNGELAELADRPKVELTLCDDSYWSEQGIPRPSKVEARQMANANNALQKARGIGLKWLAHLDADEMILGLEALIGELQGLPSSVDAVKLRVLEGIPSSAEHRNPFEEIHDFKLAAPPTITRGRTRRALVAISYEARCLLGAATPARGVLASGLINGHSSGKSLVNTAKDLRMGIHVPSLMSGRRPAVVASQTGLLAHYFGWNSRTWAEKWVNRPYLDPDKTTKVRARQLELYEESKRDLSPERIWSENFLMSSAEVEWLSRLGLVQSW